jgi:hypothetical protein
VSLGFGEAFDRERARWLAGHGGHVNGYATEGAEGQRLRHKWEEAEEVLSEIWHWYSWILQPRIMLPAFVDIDKVVRGGGV